MRLSQDLYSKSGELLVKKGVLITPALIRRIRRKGNSRQEKQIPFKRTFIFKDFKRALGDRRYAVMLRPPVSKSDICRFAGAIKLENDLISELAGIKKHLPYTYRHILIVTALSIKISLDCPRGYYDRRMVAHCGLTHDFGKTRMPVQILNKRGTLTKKERAIIETHPAVGYILLNYYLKRDRRECALANLDHHERSDGSGYPKGIRKIQRYTRLVSVIDVLDALMTRRPYRKVSFSLRATLDYLLKQANENKLDKKIVRMLIRYSRKVRPDIRTMRISRRFRERLPEELSHDKYR